MTTYEKIAAANSTIKTTDIRGKQYAMVQERVKAFRMVYPNGQIVPRMVSDEGGKCVFEACVYDGMGKLLGVGHAYEREEMSQINKTSYIENCETSAIGRALAFCGFGIDVSIASFEEVTEAIAKQPITPITARALRKELKDRGIREETVCKCYKVASIEKLNERQHQHVAEHFDKLLEAQGEADRESETSSDVSEH